MAPGRKRGAKGPKTKTELSLGDLVLAKVKGFPAWPAKISRPEDWKYTSDSKKHFVQFFGTEEIAFVAPADIQAFTSEAKSKLTARCQGKSKTVKHFARAVKEICEEFEELQRKNSSGLRDDTNKPALGCDAYVDGPTDDAVKLDFKDIVNGDGSNGETDTKGLGDNGSVLDRVGEIDYDYIKPSISCNADNSLSPVISAKKRNKLVNGGTNLPKKDDDLIDDYAKDNLVCTIRNKARADNDNSHSSGAIGDPSSLLVSVHVKEPSGGQKEVTNGYKSNMVLTGSTRKSEGAPEARKPCESAVLALACGALGQTDLSESIDYSKDDARRKISLGGSMKEVSPVAVRSHVDNGRSKQEKKMLKDKKHFEAADDLCKVAEGSSKETTKGEVSAKKTRVQLAHEKHNPVTNDVMHPAKRSKCAYDVVDKIDNAENGTALRVKEENRLASRLRAGSAGYSGPSDEDVLPPAKRRRWALDAISVSSSSLNVEDKMDQAFVAPKTDVSCSDNGNAAGAQLHTKRRAVCLFDDDGDEEPKTPVRGGPIAKVHLASRASDSVKNSDVPGERSSHNLSAGKISAGLEDGSPKDVQSDKQINESSSPDFIQSNEKRCEAVTVHVSCIPERLESENISIREAKPVLVSPKSFPLPVASKPILETQKASKSTGKVLGNILQRKAQASNRASEMGSDGSNHSLNVVTNETSKPIPSGEKQKSTPKLSSRMNDAVPSTSSVDSNLFPFERVVAGRDDKLTSYINSDSVTSMKHLIAAAQAKRRQAHLQNMSYRNFSSTLAPHADIAGRSPSPPPIAQPVISISNNTQPDVQGYQTSSSLASPSSHGRQILLNSQSDAEEFEERRGSSGHQPARGSLSGGTEAAVARDAFEGMIETLSRTKESIRRATRLAINCAKHGIANEVVELLIRKLECETSFHRRVDLFFLVDSITQCSHNEKGIAGASYIPAVQAALPRLLGAAAPPGTAARENRRQCLKVLRLWVERKIFPEPLLQHYVDDMEASSDDTSAGFAPRRPSRAERAIDDPLREMEGMLVDEYGSNATFQLPGFFSSRMFEEQDEEVDNLPSSSSKDADDGLAVEPTPAGGDSDTCAIASIDRRHCILEDVDGELEMEDVSGHLKDERLSLTNVAIEAVRWPLGADESFRDNSTELPPLPEGSPPLPLDSPPLTPPFPPSPPPPLSPPPPPPPPSSPSPPPPPPPPFFSSQPHALPPPPMGPPPAGFLQSSLPQPSLPPRPYMGSQQLRPLPPSGLPTSPKMPYQPPVPHDCNITSNASKPVQMAANAPHGSHIDAPVRSEMVPQQSPCFIPAGVSNLQDTSGFNHSRSLEYGHKEMYMNQQASQSNQQFHPGSTPFPQRPFHPTPPHTASGHFSYPVQQHSQHPYPPPYSLANHSDGVRRYGSDDQWRAPVNEFTNDNQRVMWMSGGRTSSCSGPPFGQEGYFRPPPERPLLNSVGFQYSNANALQAEASMAGHVVSQMMPSRPDMSALNCWRPA